MSSNYPFTGRPVLLLTGATGQIGRHVLKAWLQAGNQVVVTLRDPVRQWPTLQRWLAAQGVPTEGATCIATDFAQADLGWDAATLDRLKRVTCVAHWAALWGWHLPWHDADAVNVQGSLRLYEWARRQGIAGPFVCSGGFMSQIPGHIDSMGLRLSNVDWASAAKRWGAYEISKLRAYLQLHPTITGKQDLPVTWVHPATVIGDEWLPDVPPQSAIAGIMRTIRRGQLRLVPGSSVHSVPWVTGHYVARYVVALLTSNEPVMSEHLLLDPASPSLQTSVDVLSAAMNAPKTIGHVPKEWMALALRVPGVAAMMGTSSESLNFIVPTLPDSSASVQWGLRRGIAHPDVLRSLALTALTAVKKTKLPGE